MQQEPQSDNSYNSTIEGRNEEIHLINHLVSIEKIPLKIVINKNVNRAELIDMIITEIGPEGSPKVIQTACWYMDSILRTMMMPNKTSTHLAVISFWMALRSLKLENSEKHSFMFLNEIFTKNFLMNAESNILRQLDYPPAPVVPQDFIDYLSAWCGNDPEIEMAASFICLSGLMVENSLCDEYPSVIAAMSVHMAIMCLKKNYLYRRLQIAPLYGVAYKKSTNITRIYTTLRMALVKVTAPSFPYKALLGRYGASPAFITQRVALATEEFYFLDTKKKIQNRRKSI